MNNIITQTIYKFNMISPGDVVLLAVSGGADSMLMLDYFVSNASAFNIKLKVAHVEHGIRGQASIDDSVFVKNYCERNNIEYHQLSIDAVKEAKENGLSIEEYSRNRRYDFLNSIECDKIATAHNLSDNIETIVFRAVRGTGLKGLCGIPPVRGKIIRPLIELTSSQIRSYCEDNGIDYRIDETNNNNDYSRNKIRNDVLPKLADINSSYENKLAFLIDDINNAYVMIETLSNEYYSKAITDDKRLLKNELSALPDIVRSEILIKYFKEFDVDLDRFHIQEISKLIDKCGKYQIKGSSFAVSNKKYLRYADFNMEKNLFTLESEILNINEFIPANVDFYFDYDKISGSLFFRERREGDTIVPADRKCTKSLKKLFNELKVPIEERLSVPIICDDLGVIGVFGYCVDERVKVDNNTKRIIIFKLPPED